VGLDRLVELITL
jgi:hypothetical protein